MKVGDNQERQIKGLPDNPRMAYFLWSPDETKMAFTQTTKTGVEIWVLDIESET